MSQATSHQSDPRVLLRRGADGGNEAAFETLAGEFKGLVYSTALCRYDAPQMAEDVAQTVLAIVARKAKALQMVVHFAAWLHTTATGVTSHAMRTGSRHRRKIKALTAQSASISPVGGSSKDWCSMHPHRNEALERLPERDRRVVMLHYDEGLNFREIVGRLGKSEAAAQRQGQRSIEKLAGTLRREGVVCATVPVPGADLGVQFAAPAPAALATEALAISSLATASFRRRDHSDLRHEASHGPNENHLDRRCRPRPLGDPAPGDFETAAQARRAQRISAGSRV